MTDSNKVILNTGVTYIALLIKMLVGLFTVKFVLKALGEVDYGVYVVVGGVVAILEILNANMSNTSMRYLAYSLGSKNKEDIYVTFNTTVFIHYIIGLASIVLLEVGGFFMFEYVVNIPPELFNDAKIIFQFMIVTTFISVISVPYDAVTNAHEKIWMLSIFDIISVTLTFSLAMFLLVYEGDRLIMYGLCLMLIQLFMRFIKVVYAKRNFEECRKVNKTFFNKERMKEIISFTGWNLLGSVSALGAGQFRNLIVNYFFGVRLNAAQGISDTVSNPINQIAASMTRAINPQIMKSEGGQNRERMKYIVAIGAKYSSFLFALFGIPIFIELPYILDIWLDDVPEFASVFCRLTILCMLFEKFTYQITHAISAVGDIKGYQIAHAIGNYVYLPIAFVLFKLGFPPVTIYYLFFLSMALNATFRFYYGRKVAGINPWEFTKTAIVSVIIPLFIAAALALGLYYIVERGFINLLVVSLTFCISFPIFFWFMGMEEEEREKWKGIVTNTLNRFKKKHQDE